MAKGGRPARDGRPGSGSNNLAPKKCSKCGGNHWPFLACSRVEEWEARQAEKAAVAAAMPRVVPEARTRPAVSRELRSANFTAQAPGVYRRIRT